MDRLRTWTYLCDICGQLAQHTDSRMTAKTLAQLFATNLLNEKTGKNSGLSLFVENYNYIESFMQYCIENFKAMTEKVHAAQVSILW